MAKKVKPVQPIQAEVLPIPLDLEKDNVSIEKDGVVIKSAEVIVAEVKKAKARGIGKFIVDKILTTNLSNTEILAEVIKKFDGAKTTMACIAWYKTKMRKEGKIGARVTKAEEVPA
jgi:hypothetical protein